MMVYIAETMERQHGGLVLSVDALTRTVCMIYVATLRLNPLQCTYYCQQLIDGGCILSEPLPHVPEYTSGYISVKD